jgi:hypothetical protein
MIKDSGTRRTFSTGSVRDNAEGKGRCDLLPLDVAARLTPIDGNKHKVLESIGLFMETDNVYHLVHALELFREDRGWDSPTMLLEVSKHFEEGNKKYPPDEDGTPNWKKGIPIHCYVDSGTRHFLKWCRGDDDENHDRAFCWNLMSALWTIKHKPELDDYRKKDQTNA